MDEYKIRVTLDKCCLNRIAGISYQKTCRKKDVVVSSIKYFYNNYIKNLVNVAQVIIDYDNLRCVLKKEKYSQHHDLYYVDKDVSQLLDLLIERMGLPKATTFRLAIYSYWVSLNREEAQSIVDKMDKIKELLR